MPSGLLRTEGPSPTPMDPVTTSIGPPHGASLRQWPHALAVTDRVDTPGQVYVAAAVCSSSHWLLETETFPVASTALRDGLGA